MSPEAAVEVESPARAERAEIEATIEAILFVSNEPVSRDRIFGLFEAEERAEVEAALESVLGRYAPAENRGVTAEEVAGGFRLVTRPQLHDSLRTFFEVSAPNRLSMAALETLAIVAYRQPVTAPEIQELRGKSSSGVLKTLLEKRLVRISGRKQVVGKPFLYSTTREFVQLFGLGSLEDLPPLEDLDELLEGEAPDEAPGDREEALMREAAELAEREEDEDDG